VIEESKPAQHEAPWWVVSCNTAQKLTNGKKTFNIAVIQLVNTKNCSLSIVLTATDQKPQKSLKR